MRVFFYVSLTLFSFLSSCKKPESDVSQESKPEPLSAVVVFAIGDSKVRHADQTEEKAQLGTTLAAGDNIVTGEAGKVDIQFPDGSSIRISPKSTIDFSKLSQTAGGATETQVALVSGKVFAKVNKGQKQDNFSVVTPTAIAGVRGTSFIVESGSGSLGDSVKVVEGSVSFAPRILALEKASNEEIERSEDLKKLQNSLATVEVILEQNQESKLSKKAADLAKIEKLEGLDIDKTIKAIEKEKPAVEAAKLTKKEEEEIKTIVQVDKETAKQIIALNESANVDKLDELKKKEIDKQRLAIEEEVKKKQIEEKKRFEETLANKPKDFKTREDVLNYYESIERITLTDGKTILGAIISQEGEYIIVQTENGVKRISKEEVDEVNYDVQKKKKN